MVFTNYRPVFKGLGTFKAVEDVEKRVMNSEYSNDNNPKGKIKRINFFLDTGEDGRFKLEYTGFNSAVTAFDKNDRNNRRKLEYGEKVEDDFLNKFNVMGAFTLTTPKSEKIFIYSYEVAETIEQMYNKWEKSEPILEITGEVRLEPYTPVNGTTTMMTKYVVTGIKEISKDSFKKNKLDMEVKLTIPAVIKKSEIEALSSYDTPEESSIRIPVYTPIYIQKTKEYIYYPQEIILSSKYIFGKSFENNEDLTAPKSIMNMLKDNMLEGNTEYRAIRYEATAVNKYEEKKKEFTPDDLNEHEKEIYNLYLRTEEEKKKFLLYKCKEVQFVSSVVRKNFMDLLLVSNEFSGYTEPLNENNVCILDASQIETLRKTGLKPIIKQKPKDTSKENNSFFEVDSEEPKEVKEDIVEDTQEKEEVKTVYEKTAEEVIQENDLDNENIIDDDDFPF